MDVFLVSGGCCACLFSFPSLTTGESARLRKHAENEDISLSVTCVFVPRTLVQKVSRLCFQTDVYCRQNFLVLTAVFQLPSKYDQFTKHFYTLF